jgi:transcriptional regulator with XRE-family HTH domain
MTQEELARRAQVRRPTISDIERGLHWPTEETLELVAKALRVRVNDLFTDPFQPARSRVDRRRKRR